MPRRVAVESSAVDADMDRAIDEAEDRLARSTGLLGRLFPAIGDADAPLRSPLVPVPSLAQALGEAAEAAAQWRVKADHQLPIAGSVKARGGFHEVIAFAEGLAVKNGLIAPDADLTALADVEARDLFSRYSVIVGSTGNLGMGIGMISAALGFRAMVHMSREAKAWKKRRLRDHGVTVIEHDGDYAEAVANGRVAAEQDPLAHFVDDERSIDLFTGYAAAARELAAQLQGEGIVVDQGHPLFVYIPCGVGGAPGGITYGLKRVFGEHVHCIFAEPAQSPCMLVQMLSGMDRCVSVYDVGLTNSTEADGLAVAQASMLVAPLMVERLDAIYTLTDEQLLALYCADQETTRLGVEPSAAAGFAGPLMLSTDDGKAYLGRHGLSALMAQANHIIWTTGGSLVPADERVSLLAKARGLPPFSVMSGAGRRS